MHRGIIIIIGLLFILGSGSSAIAQKTGKKKRPTPFFSKDSSHWIATIPIWIPGFRGNLSYGDFALDRPEGEGEGYNPFEYSTSIEFYFIAKVGYRLKGFFIEADVFSGTIGNSLTFVPTGNEVLQASIAAVLPRLVVGYQVYRASFMQGNSSVQVGVYTGFRYNHINVSSENNEGLDNLDLSVGWTDLLIGLQVPVYLKRWAIITQLDVGGLEDGDKLSFMFEFKGQYRVSKLISIPVAWTAMNIKYEKEVLGEPLIAHIKLAGPIIGISFHF